MEISASVDLGQVAREVNLPPEAVERTVALLDDGNTVPFITRFRKDHTGGLDEQQIRGIELRVTKLRLLAERKQTILKSLESQNKLSDDLKGRIESAQSNKRLEDLYLPYKPKKQTLATAARERGLEPLAQEILSEDSAAADLDARAAAFVDPDKGVANTAEVLLGVGHLIAEQFGEHADLRGRLRRILWRSGKLVTARVPPPEEPAPKPVVETSTAEKGEASAEASAPKDPQPEPAAAPSDPPPAEGATAEPVASDTPTEPPVAEPAPVDANPPTPEAPTEPSATEAVPAEAPAATEPPAEVTTTEITTPAEPSPTEPTASSETPTAESTATEASPPPAPDASTSETSPSDSPTPAPAATATTPPSTEQKPADAKPETVKPAAKAKKEKKKKKKKGKQDEAFKDYYDFSEGLNRLPPHRILAINRGERAKAIRVRIDFDEPAMQSEANELLVTEGHAHADFLRSCARDALTRLMVPSLEREARRELSEKAEDHAIDVFAQNLRKLLLQPPLRGRRVLAIDPGYRSGCKIAVVDPFGEVLDHATVHVVGREERRKSGRALLVGLIKKYNVSVVAIGNGAASREAEQLVSGVINDELKDHDVAFVIVNEAGASVYSTSQIGREEFPKFDPTVRSAISIARRLLDPLSELVKINPAHIGVGMYQHDVKSKHLRETLDAVVESCVNFVGVDCNTASPSLLRYVSGLNQLHARRIYEHRQLKGPYRNRQQLNDAPNIGEATFQQAAGFLKILGSEHPLDVTWIHPESYDLAEKVLAKVGVSLDQLKLNLSPEAEAYGFAGGKENEPVEETTTFKMATAAVVDTPATDAAATEPAATEPAATAADATPATPAPEVAPSVASEQASTTTPAEASAEPTRSTDAESAAPAEPSAEASAEAAQADGSAPATEPVAEAASEPSTEVSEEPTEATPSETSPAAESSEASTAETSTPEPSAPEPDPVDHTALAREAWETALAEQRAKFEALAENVAKLNLEELAKELGVGQLSLSYLLKAITRPGRDPRDDLPQPVLRRGIMKLEDLQPGMELTGSVLNVVDFGAFVDIGLTDSGLVHISRLADQYVKDPHEVVSVGDVLQVWVMEVDPKRRRVSLTAIKPGTEKPKEERQRGRGRKKPEGSAEGGKPPARGGDKSQGRRDRPQRKGGRGRDQQRPATPRSYVVDAKPKEAKPLKKKVIEGKEPMRSFSDLVQFYEEKDDDPGKKKKK